MTGSSPADLLRGIVGMLEAIDIPYMVVGSFASTAHGEPRSTHDLDLVIDPSAEQLEDLLGMLDPEHYYVDPDVAREALRRRSMFNVIEIQTAWKLDLIVRKARPFSIEEMQRRQRIRMLGVEVATATAEDTIIAKLEWAKEGGTDRQIEDVAGILRIRGSSIDLDYIERWVQQLDVVEQWDRARAASSTPRSS